MSDNWVVQNLENALEVWNEKLAEIWTLITQSPQAFKGGSIWSVIVSVHGALQAIGYALLVLFFVVGVMRTCGSFAEVKKPEHAGKLFVRFAIAKGIITYGMYPSDEVDPGLLNLRPALRWLSRVTHVKTLPAGREISYGGTYVTTRDTVVATIPVGYADGYRRNLSGKFYVLIHGKKAPILGRICMDQMMVDVTGIPGVKVGDRVTLVGTDGGETITMEAISALADSFNYEFVCGISRRVPRVYLQGGKPVRSVHYLLDAFL